MLRRRTSGPPRTSTRHAPRPAPMLKLGNCIDWGDPLGFGVPTGCGDPMGHVRRRQHHMSIVTGRNMTLPRAIAWLTAEAVCACWGHNRARHAPGRGRKVGLAGRSPPRGRSNPTPKYCTWSPPGRGKERLPSRSMPRPRMEHDLIHDVAQPNLVELGANWAVSWLMFGRTR